MISCNCVLFVTLNKFVIFVSCPCFNDRKLVYALTSAKSQHYHVGVLGGFSRGSPPLAPPTDWSVSYELK